MEETTDILVIGAGIAGASVASELAESASVLLVEAESQPGYHSTGRSAAQFIQNYGPPDVRALSAASRPFFEAPPEGFSDEPLIRPRSLLLVAGEDGRAALDTEVAAGHGLRRLSADEAAKLVPLLRPGAVVAAALEADSQDLEVAELHQAYLRRFRRGGGRVVVDARVTLIQREGDRWRVRTDAGDIVARRLVNAAGAWADEIAALAGLQPVGLTPKRRTALLVEGSATLDISDWPLVADAQERWYCKPEPGGKLLVSPADATPSPPSDVRPEELDIAVAVDRFQEFVDLPVRRILHSWAGLRTFAPDGSLVIGRDPAAPDFLWLAGQGGYGIQTSPAAARLAAALLLRDEVPADIADAGLDRAAVDPARLLRG